MFQIIVSYDDDANDCTRVVRGSKFNSAQPSPSTTDPSQNHSFGPMTQPNPQPNRTPYNNNKPLAQGRQFYAHHFSETL